MVILHWFFPTHSWKFCWILSCSTSTFSFQSSESYLLGTWHPCLRFKEMGAVVVFEDSEVVEGQWLVEMLLNSGDPIPNSTRSLISELAGHEISIVLQMLMACLKQRFCI